MNSDVKHILSLFKGNKKVDKISNAGNKYIISLSVNGEPLIDEMYLYENGKLKPYEPSKNIKEFLLLQRNVIYDRRKKRYES